MMMMTLPMTTLLLFAPQTKEELEEQEQAIRDLEAAVQAKEAPLKLAETRLENRTNRSGKIKLTKIIILDLAFFRPHVELCSDLPLEGLIAEVDAIKKSIQMLEDKLDNAREADSELEQHLKDLQDDHQRKSQALSLDQRWGRRFFRRCTGQNRVLNFIWESAQVRGRPGQADHPRRRRQVPDRQEHEADRGAQVRYSIKK